MIPRRPRAACPVGVVLLLFLSLAAAPLAAQAKGGGIFDSLALGRLLAPLKNGPKSPQPVLLAFAEDGSLDRLALSDSIPSQLRDLMRDSLPHVVRTDSAFANLRVRLFLVAAKPMQLVPACEELPPQFIEPTTPDLERAMVNPGMTATRTIQVETESPPTPRDIERALGKPVPVRIAVAMVVLPGGRVTGATVSYLTGGVSNAPSSSRMLEALSLKQAPGATWTAACLYRTVFDRIERRLP